MPTVLITGAAKRLGKVLAEFFASKNWEVIIHYNNSDNAAKELSLSLQKKYYGREFSIVKADLSDPEQASALLINQLHIKRPDLLINCASIFESSNIGETNYKLLRRHMKVNFEAPFMLMHEFYNCYGKGNIINILDARIISNSWSHAAYSLSKKSLTELTRMAAFEWAPNIRVNAVAPGPVLPPPGKDKSYLERVAADTPLKKSVDLNSFLESVWFLVTNSAITGQIIYCDSGAHLKG